MKTLICPICKTEFTTNRRQTYCKNAHTKRCKICGKEFTVAQDRLWEYDSIDICGSKECTAAKKSASLKMLPRSTFAPKSGRVCKLCGDSFSPETSRQYYCKKPVTKICAVCGEPYGGICHPDDKTVCDKPECKKLAGFVASSKQIQRTCRVCGKLFTPQSARQLDCNEPVKRVCKVCGKEYDSVCSQNVASQTCSDSCKNKLGAINREATYSFAEKQCEWCGQLFNPISNTQIFCTRQHYQICKVCGEKFKVDVHKQEIPVTCSAECRCILAHESVTPETIAAVTRRKRLERFGGDLDKLDRCERFTSDTLAFLKSLDNKPTLHELSELTGLSELTVGQAVINCNGKEYINYYVSKMEQDVISYIKSLVSDALVIHNTDRIITPYQIDIWLPEYNFGIECNPTSTHNSSVPMISGDPIPEGYHKMKTDLAEYKGTFILHLFGYDWIHRNDIMKSMIRNLVKANTRKLYARKCEIREVSGSEAREFLITNHRQGWCGSTIRIGLYLAGELVAIMTFGNTRNTIGGSSEAGCYELFRFCSTLNTTVVGGAQKLFKYFVDNYQPIMVRSFSDRARTRGTTYSNLGFTEMRRSDPGYVWVNSKDDKAYSRVNAQKANIKKFLKDDSIDLSLTERDIMESHGFVRVYDSGTITWEWRQN